jgi:cysteinyl-tRNA synthetase
MEVKHIKNISDIADKIISMHDRQRLLFRRPLTAAIGPQKQSVLTGNDLDPLGMKARQYIMVRANFIATTENRLYI